MPYIVRHKHSLFFVLLFVLSLTNAAIAQSPPTNRCDGPYVFYRGNETQVKAIDSNGNRVLDSFPLSEKTAHKLQIHFSNHRGWDFTVSLRKSIRPEPSTFKAPPKIFALSDIEGEFDNFRALLIAGGVMDSAYRWTWGRGHLVVCGDLFDRGNDVVPELWLLYKLEDEARAAGGYVHTILGNHDIMNLSGDLRYVLPRYFANAKTLGVEYPFLYDSATELGRWLRSKNIIEKIGKNLCLHGGISSEVQAKQIPLDALNAGCRPFYDRSRDKEIFEEFPEMKIFFGASSPFWYRGYFMDPRASQSLVDSTLAFHKCTRIIVGHTITDANIADYYDHKIIGLDVDEHEGHSEAIIIDRNKIFAVDRTGVRKPIEIGPLYPVVR